MKNAGTGLFGRLNDDCRGITVMELIISLAIMGFVIAGSFAIIMFINGGYGRVQASYDGIVDGNTFSYRFGKEIIAAERPNDTKFAVEVYPAGGSFLAGQRIDIYQKYLPYEPDIDGSTVNLSSTRYKRISYQLINSNIIQRGWVMSTNPAEVIPGGTGSLTIPAAGSSSPGSWRTILTGVTDASGNSNPADVFKDLTDSGREQRLVSLNITVTDLSGTKYTAKPVTVNTQYMSRTKTLNISNGQVTENYVPVTGIRITNSTFPSVVPKGGGTYQLTVEVMPPNATVRDFAVIGNDPDTGLFDWVTVSRSGNIVTVQVHSYDLLWFGTRRGSLDIISQYNNSIRTTYNFEQYRHN